MIQIFIMAGILFVLAWIIRQPFFKGKLGELLVSICLKRSLAKPTYLRLNNVMIPDGEGGTTQIDHIVISPYSIFIIETKNMRGWIFGDIKSAKWTQQIFRSKHQFQNPFRQNYKHIACLAECLGLPEDCFTHIVVFVGRCEIKTRDKLPDALVTNGSELIRFIHTFKEQRFEFEDLVKINDAILEWRVSNTLRNTRAHVNHVKAIVEAKAERTQTHASAPSKPRAPIQSTNGPICPKCGAPLVRRQTKRGENAGREFWGCSAYPKCHYTSQD